MKKILFITAFPPNRKTAGQNFTKELLSNLTDSFKVDLIYFSYPNHFLEINNDINIIKQYKANAFTKLISWLKAPFFHPFFVIRFKIRIMFFLLKNTKKYDVIYFDFSQVFIFSFFCKKSFKVFMCHDVIFQKLERKKNIFFKPINSLLFATEKTMLKNADLILSFSKKDQKLIYDLYGINSTIVNFFIDEKIKNIDYKNININQKFVFYGAWNRMENLKGLEWFLVNVFPFINSNIKFDIIGPGLDENILKEHQSNGRIIYHGFVDNPYIIIAESLALIAPVFQGAGVKVKVIESLATGTSIIGSMVAFEGVDDLGDDSMIYCKLDKDYIKIINEFPQDIKAKKIETKLRFELNYSEINFCNLLADKVDSF